MKCFIITGLSGSGKTTALKAFEDIGYYCMDNIPALIIPEAINILKEKTDIKRIAIGVDIRERIFVDKFQQIFIKLKNEFNYVKIIYLSADKNVILRRFKETRRQHPLKGFTILEAIKEEERILENIKAIAEITIDTTYYTVHDLKKYIYDNFSDLQSDFFNVNIVSFGYKNGILIEGDLIFDVRFMPNPYFIDNLKDKTGLDKDVEDYVFSHATTKKFYNKITEMLKFLIPEYRKEGKNILVIGFGCTGGKHRSVAIANRIYNDLKELFPLTIKHRDL